MRKTAYMLDKGLDFREQAKGRGNFTDIMYSGLVQNPMDQPSKIYERYGGISDAFF